MTLSYLLLFLSHCLADQLKDVSTSTEKLIIPARFYDITTSQIIFLNYLKQTPGYQIEIYIKDSGTPEKPMNESAIQEYVLQTDDTLEQLGCQRSVAYATVETLSQLVPKVDENIYFTGMISLDNDKWVQRFITDESENNFTEYLGRAFVIDNLFTFKEIQISYINHTINLEEQPQTFDSTLFQGNELTNLSFSNKSLNFLPYMAISQPGGIQIYTPYMLYDKKTQKGYVLSSLGAVSFEPNNEWNIDEDLKIRKQPEFINRKNIQYATIIEDKGYLLTANGAEGVDIYQITSNGDLKLVSTLAPGKEPEQLDGFVNNGNDNIDIVDVNYQSRRDILIAMDKNYGLIFFDMETPEEPKRKFYNIKGENGKAFDLYHQTLITIYEKKNQYDIVVEYFIDYEYGDYFINNVFTYNQVSDLQITPFYAILMTGNVNQIYQHSIYNGFQNLTAVPVKRFFGNGTLQINLISKFDEKTNQTTSFLMGLGYNTFTVNKYTEHPPMLQCSCKEEMKKNFGIRLRSTLCTTDTLGTDYQESPYFSCELYHFFFLQVSEVYLDSRNEKMALILGLVLGLICLILIIIACICFCRQRMRMTKKEMQWLNCQNIEINPLQIEGEKMLALEAQYQVEGEVRMIQDEKQQQVSSL